MSTELDHKFEEQVAKIRAETSRRDAITSARRNMWLTHHWPVDYAKRCTMVGGRHVCRRCASLYPMGLLVAALAVAGLGLWPQSWDPEAIWILCLPATFAYVGESVGWFRYSAKPQVAAMLITATAFGKGLSYELQNRWSSEFWEPVAVFGGIWFIATAWAMFDRPKPSKIADRVRTGSRGEA